MENKEGDVLPFGVRADTGTVLPGLTDEAIVALLKGEHQVTPELKIAHENRADLGRAQFAVDGDTDPGNLAQAGWGIIFGPDTSPEIKRALGPLIEHRRGQGADPLVIYDQDGFRSGETAYQWLRRHKTSLNVVAPAQDGVPFYLMLVAPPDVIPFEFQYVLDLYWAVGRLWFETIDGFRHYVKSVIDYETGSRVPTARQMAMFAPKHDFDRATQLFVEQVAVPLQNGVGTKVPRIGKHQDFALRTFLGDEATKANLLKVYRGEVEGGPPALLFSGSHGMAFGSGDPNQLAAQGALVCQDWNRLGKIEPQHWFAGSDVPSDAHIHGLMQIVFACYGGGVPEFDDFDRFNKAPKRIAARPFISRLPQALLGHALGGALATLVHVERAWAYTFQSDGFYPQIQGFRDVIGRLLRGERIGAATDSFNARWAALSTRLSELQIEMANNPELPLRALGNLWVARDDARNFIILGDPAVRLRQEDML